MAEAWQEALARLERRGPIPSPWSILSLEVRRGYWDVLAYEQAAQAREDFNRCVQQLREAYDTHPELGTVAADEMTDRAIQQARADFDDALRREGQPHLFGEARHDWRDRRGRAGFYC